MSTKSFEVKDFFKPYTVSVGSALIALLIFTGASSLFATKAPAYQPIQFYNRSGVLNQNMKILIDTITLTSASGQVIDVSSAGFTKILSVQVQAELNTNNASVSPIVDVKSYTTTSITTNTFQANSQTVSILGINVIGLQFLQSTAGTKLHICIVGY